MYTALTEVAGEYENAKVFSDIGCYTLGWLSPFHAIDTCVDMGASITMAKGAADAGLGVDPAHIRVVVPLPRTREEMKAIIREEIAYDGVSVIIPRRECIQTAKRHNATKQKQ